MDGNWSEPDSSPSRAFVEHWDTFRVDAIVTHTA